LTTEAITIPPGTAAPKKSGPLRRMMAPGWYRAAWMTLGGAAFAFALVIALRALQDMPLFKGSPIVTVILIVAPLAFLVGIGGFDYWAKWMIGSPTEPEDHSGHGARSWRDYFRVNTDHKVIGIQYTVTAFFFFLFAGGLAEIMRVELAQPGQQVVDSNTFNGLFSVHAALMIFLVVIPIFAGLANYVIPLMIGAPDMAFPRLNALSYWLLPVAGIMMVASFLVPDGGAFNTGWTAYAPLSTDAPLGQQFFTIGVQFAGTSSIMTALNFLVTIITMRAPGMTFWRMPLLVWANFTTSLLVVIATPFVAGSQFLVLLDRALNANFFQASAGGDVVSYQHIFWFYSHPAVYIMMLPGFGIISEVISAKSRKPIFGYRLMALSLLAILVLGFTVWAHHMFVSGMFSWLRVPMMITTVLIAVPTGIKIFSWLATLWRGVLELSAPMLFALGFITMFTLGGISGIMLAALPVVIHTSDTYFVVAHIHYVLFGGSIFTVFAGVYYWFPKMTGRMYDETLGKLHFWLTFIGFNFTFGPMHWIGLEGMPRRVADYADKFADWNLFVSVSAFLFGAAQLLFFYNMIVSWKWGPRAPGNPWRAKTLEWQVSSPPPVFNFDEIPQVVGGPYEYGVPGAVHAVMNGGREKVPVGAGSGHASGAAGNGHGAGGGHGGEEGNGHDTVARE
jgi:cytochrome c oxidase subunit I